MICGLDGDGHGGERLGIRELLIALTTNVSIFDSECSLPLTIRKHKEWFFRPVQGRHYVLATLRNRKRQTQDSNPRFTAPTEIRRKHRPQMDASDDFVTLSQARRPRCLPGAGHISRCPTVWQALEH